MALAGTRNRSRSIATRAGLRAGGRQHTRTPTISDADYRQLLDIATREGYDPARVQNVPQRPSQ